MRNAVQMLGVGMLVVLAAATADARPPWTFRRPARARVDKPWEAKADKNKDGRVGPAEAAAARRNLYLRTRSAVNRPWEAEADKNNDGQVDGRELRLYHLNLLDANHDGKIQPAERLAYWKHRWAIVNTEIEKRYDKDGDGYLDWPEAREMLRDKHTLIMTGGQAKVDTDIELEFDVNEDGVIDRAEAPALLAAIEASS